MTRETPAHRLYSHVATFPCHRGYAAAVGYPVTLVLTAKSAGQSAWNHLGYFSGNDYVPLLFICATLMAPFPLFWPPAGYIKDNPDITAPFRHSFAAPLLFGSRDLAAYLITTPGETSYHANLESSRRPLSAPG